MVLTTASVTAERLHVSVIFDLNLCVFVLHSFHAEEPGYSVGGCGNRHPSERADEAHPKTYGTISCSCALALNTSRFVKCSFLFFCFFCFCFWKERNNFPHVSHFVSPAGNPRVRLCHHKQRLHPDPPRPQTFGNPLSKR